MPSPSPPHIIKEHVPSEPVRSPPPRPPTLRPPLAAQLFVNTITYNVQNQYRSTPPVQWKVREA